MTFCYNCGSELSRESAFCYQCGTKVRAEVKLSIEESMEKTFEETSDQIEKALNKAGEAIKKTFIESEKVIKEEFEVSGNDLSDKVKELINEGNIRRIIIKNQEGETLMEFPLTVGVIGTVLAPILAALGAIAALAMKYTIVVERQEK